MSSGAPYPQQHGGGQRRHSLCSFPSPLCGYLESLTGKKAVEAGAESGLWLGSVCWPLPYLNLKARGTLSAPVLTVGAHVNVETQYLEEGPGQGIECLVVQEADLQPQYWPSC